MTGISRVLQLFAIVLALSSLFCLTSYGIAKADDPAVFQDDPKAHALYDRMIQAMHEADSLSWVSDYRWDSDGTELGHATYRIWLKKPNQVRVEAVPAGSTSPTGILVGDGDYFWTHWPGGKGRNIWEFEGEYAKEYEKHRLTFYQKEGSPPGRHSISHLIAMLGARISLPVINPSMFHGCTSSLASQLDGVRFIGSEQIDGQEFDVIELSYMDHQRSRYLWLSRDDHLPRKLEQVIRANSEIITRETWSKLAINADLPPELFTWSPPNGWREWSVPPIEIGLLPPGTKAPDFEFASLAGGKVKLSDLKGRHVLLIKWRCG